LLQFKQVGDLLEDDRDLGISDAHGSTPLADLPGWKRLRQPYRSCRRSDEQGPPTRASDCRVLPMPCGRDDLGQLRHRVGIGRFWKHADS
jgi:hypothetical protein